MKIHSKSAWQESQITEFLSTACIPLRIASPGTDGFPTICSLWFLYEDGALWSASHKNAYIISQLQNDHHVGFEVATNEFPYRGVRGRGTASLTSENAGALLQRLIDRYLQDSNRELADWLMSRSADELAIRITPHTINAWDFTHRMQQA